MNQEDKIQNNTDNDMPCRCFAYVYSCLANRSSAIFS